MLIVMGTPAQFAASVLTAMLYVLFAGQHFPVWYAPLFGSLVVYSVCLVLAFPCKLMATAEYTNRKSYGLLRIRVAQLETRLAVMNDLRTQEECMVQKTVEEQEWLQLLELREKRTFFGTRKALQRQKALKISKTIQQRHTWPGYRQVALAEAIRCHQDVKLFLCEKRSGLLWVTRIGYLTAWNMVHRTEEALIKAEPLEMVLRGAMHDRLAIQNSKMSKRDELLKQLDSACQDIKASLLPQAASPLFSLIPEIIPGAKNDTEANILCPSPG